MGLTVNEYNYKNKSKVKIKKCSRFFGQHSGLGKIDVGSFKSTSLFIRVNFKTGRDDYRIKGGQLDLEFVNVKNIYELW